MLIFQLYCSDKVNNEEKIMPFNFIIQKSDNVWRAY